MGQRRFPGGGGTLSRHALPLDDSTSVGMAPHIVGPSTTDPLLVWPLDWHRRMSLGEAVAG
jgi:hypothetical protein